MTSGVRQFLRPPGERVLFFRVQITPGFVLVAMNRLGKRVATGFDNLALLNRRLDLSRPSLRNAPLRKRLRDGLRGRPSAP